MLLKTMQGSWILFVALTVLGVVYMASSFASTEKLSLDIKQEAIIIDVRSYPEYVAASNPASINIPLGELEAKLATLDKEKTIIVCCKSGRRSAIAAEILKRNGFKNVIDAGPWRNTI